MILSLSVTGWAIETYDGTKLELEDLDPAALNVPVVGQVEEDEKADAPAYGLNDIVRVSVFLNSPATIDAGYSTQNIASNPGAMAYRQALRNQQAQMTAAIEQKLGGKLDVKWNLTLAANAISANVRYGDIAAIEAIPGVKSVVIENRYEPLKGIGENRPDTAITTEYMVGATAAWADGYTGAGSRIAVIDTGLDYLHQSFDADALMHALEEDAEKAGTTVADYNLLTEEEISSVASELNGSGVFMNNKVAYAYNYVDRNTTVDHMHDKQEEHGSHVSGIATANRYVKVDGEFVDAASTVFAVGVAPDAQIMVMKVFGAGGGAYDSDYMVAIEDAIVLKADSVNLSLGSGAPGWTFSGEYEDIMNSLVENHTVVTISAGNSGSWSDSLEGDNAIGYIYSQDISLHTGGSPGTFTNSLGVASADNVGQTGTPLIFNGELAAFFSETSGYGNLPIASIAGTYDYVYLNSVGTDEEWDAIGEFVAGKVAMCNRGSSSFFEKANAAARNGAVAVVIVNNQPGVINMNLSGYQYTAPAVSITQADGKAVMKASETETAGGITVYTGKVEITSQLQTGVNMERSEATISSFSSWGVPGSLVMKPEITAPGGDIYSVNGAHLDNTTGEVVAGDNATYESMSGTSMAAPQTAGMAAVLGQYIRENGLDKWTDGNPRTLINSLLMSTATPMIETDSGYYYSVLRQGAGLADVYAATQAKSFITMNEDATASYADGKVKAELGDDPAREGLYTYSFNLTNMSEQTLSYELNTDMFTQDVFAYNGWTWMDTWTVKVPAEVTYEWGDFEFEEHDVDKNGITNAADADAILKYLTGELAEEDLDLAAGDMDEDGKASSYDAHLLLALLAEEIEERGDLVVPAGETVTVTVTIQLTDTAMLDDEVRNGAYVEGFTYVTCADATEEGELLDVEHSIPILGFYGSWTDASMFDHNTAIDAIYGDLPAYIPTNEGRAGLQLKYADGKSAVFAGNPYVVEDEFPADRLAMSSKTIMTAYKYGLIRNAGTTEFFITDADNEILFSGGANQDVFGAWYYVNGATWQDTALQNQRIGLDVASLGVSEGDQFTTAMYAIPELNAMQVNGGTSGNVTEEELLAIIDSGVLGEGASQSLTFTVDDKAPEILSATLSEDGKSITVTAKDDNYIAYLGVMDINGKVSYVGGVPEQSEKGETVEATFALDPETMGNAAALFVGDYARNESASLVRLADGPIITTTTVWALTDTLESGKEYIIATSNTAGNAYALGSGNVTTPSSTNVEWTTAEKVKIQANDTFGPYIDVADVDDSFVWTTSEGIKFTNNGTGAELGYYGTDYPYASWDPVFGYADSFTYTDHKLMVTSNSGMYFEGGYFMYGTPGDIYLYTPVDIDQEIDPDNASAVVVTPERLTLILTVDETRQLNVRVEPIVLPDKTVTWVSSDEDVATVDANGLVTAVGKGTATITATSNTTPTVSGTCVVNVTDSNPMDAVVNAQVAFGKEDIQFAEINLNDMSTTNLGGEPFSAFYGGGRSGNYIYGNDIDNDFHRYDITSEYAYDSDFHFVITDAYAALDVATIPHFSLKDSDGNEYPFDFDLLCVSPAGYLEMFLTGSTRFYYFDLASEFGAAPVAIAFVGINADKETDEVKGLYYYLLDETGELWIVLLSPIINNGSIDFNIQYGDIGNVGVITMGDDITAYSMTYGYYQTGADGVFLADNNNQTIWYVDTATMDASYVGRLNEATSLTSLYNDDYDSLDAWSVVEVQDFNGKLTCAGAPAQVMDARGEKRSDRVAGGLNAVTNVAPAADRPDFAVTMPYEDGSNYYVAVVMDNSTNGLYELTYDAEKTALVDYAAFDKNDEDLQHFFLVDDGKGTVTFDFAAADMESPYVMLLFKTPCEDADLTLLTRELGENLDAGVIDKMVIPGEHQWGEPTWEWAEDFSSATATFVCERDESHTETLEAEITVEVKDGKFIYTATVTGPDGETYTDTAEQTGFRIIVEDKTAGKATVNTEPLYLPGEAVFTVECEQACLVAVKNDDGTYTVLECADAEGTHVFNVTIENADVTVVVALKGDADLDGSVGAKDATLVKQVYLETAVFEVDEALQNLTGDAFPDGKITSKDSTAIKQVVLGTRTLEW